jgi:hypothetical protein
VAGLSAPGRFLFAVIVFRRDGCATYGNSCTPLAGMAHNGEIGYESLLETSSLKITKSSGKLQIRDKREVI